MPKSHVSRFVPQEFQGDILDWYAKNQRVLPWRVVGRKKTDPYKVWLSEIMLQQTTVPAVIPYFLRFTEKWPTVDDLAKADDAEVMAAWAGLGYYARARNLLKCARMVSMELGGKFPDTLDGLLTLPGVGPYTAAAISAIAYGQSSTVVDGNIERITSRVFAIDTPYPDGKKEVHHQAHELFKGVEGQRLHDIKAYPQALMDIGAGICTPKSPKCHLCPIIRFCKANFEGNPEKYPVKAPKKSVPSRKGDVYWIFDAKGHVIFEKRPDDRMLGGMIGLPTSDWDLNSSEKSGRPFDLIKKIKKFDEIGKIHHVFTHFKLELTVWGASIPQSENMIKLYPDLVLYNLGEKKLTEIGLPTLFLKAARLAHNFSISKA